MHTVTNTVTMKIFSVALVLTALLAMTMARVGMKGKLARIGIQGKCDKTLNVYIHACCYNVCEDTPLIVVLYRGF